MDVNISIGKYADISIYNHYEELCCRYPFQQKLSKLLLPVLVSQTHYGSRMTDVPRSDDAQLVKQPDWLGVQLYGMLVLPQASCVGMDACLCDGNDDGSWEPHICYSCCPCQPGVPGQSALATGSKVRMRRLEEIQS